MKKILRQITLKSIEECGLQFIHKVQKLNELQKKRAIIYIISFALLNLAYSLFSIYTLVSFGILIGGIGIYVKLNLDSILKKGFIAYLPSKMARAFTSRSIFDILCDIWFIPKISIYIKAIALPLFCKITPEEAISQLDELHPQIRRAFLTKVDFIS